MKTQTLKPGRNVFVSLCGETFIDIRHKVYPAGTEIRVVVLSLCGSVTLLVPIGTNVTVRRIMLCGERDVDVEETTDPQAPRLWLRVTMLCGDVKVRSGV